MKKVTTVAVIAALALATQAFAMGGSSKSGQTMSSSKSTNTMNTRPTMTTGTHAMTSAAAINGTGTMTTRMSATGTTTSQMTTGTPMHQAAAK